MYEELVKALRCCIDDNIPCFDCPRFNKCMADRNMSSLFSDAADAIEELSKRIDRAVDIYNRNVEKTAMYEVLVGIAPEPPKEETV